ncbi:thioredoxin-like protein [Daedaleopsis nitida]|nr:thioredoxin-like protein [Daedaleopsis nitida]
MVQTFTLYDNPFSPYTQRVKIALTEANAEYTSVDIDLHNKPAWFTTKVNPEGKVPAVVYGPKFGAPEDPSPEATMLNESLIIVEFIAELFPESKLHPADLVQRARARLFISVVEQKLFEGFKNFIVIGESNESLLAGLEAVQACLPEMGFAVGEWSIADVAAAPFLIRTMMFLERDIGKFPVGEGPKTLEELQKPKYARLAKYIQDISTRPSVQATFSLEAEVQFWKEHLINRQRN